MNLSKWWNKILPILNVTLLYQGKTSRYRLGMASHNLLKMDQKLFLFSGIGTHYFVIRGEKVLQDFSIH